MAQVMDEKEGLSYGKKERNGDTEKLPFRIGLS
jgi:hypothetical protein